MPTSDSGKAIASRNATTHGLFARDIVLPSLGEDPEGYRQVEAEWMAQLAPRNLLERHYVEKIAAASWRLRRLHRWQAQLFEDTALTEDERMDRLDKVLRHETALHRQIDTAVKMLGKEVPQLYRDRAREQVLEENRISERECRDDWEYDRIVDLATRSRLNHVRETTQQAAEALASAPLDAVPVEICQNEPATVDQVVSEDPCLFLLPGNCQNEPHGSVPQPFAPILTASASPLRKNWRMAVVG